MAPFFPHGYALLVGVGQTAHPPWSLPVTVKDATAIRRIFVDPNLCAYPADEEHVRLLHDAAATRSAIMDGLAWLAQRAQADPEATVVVYYSGHGWLDETSGQYYLIQHDTKSHNIPRSAIAAEGFVEALRAIAARRLLVILDCCHAEGMATAKTGMVQDDDEMPYGYAPVAPPLNLVQALKQGEGRAVFTSSRGNQRSWIRQDGTLSLYTYHLLEALQGAGNRPGDEVVCLSNLMNHLGRAVPASATQLGCEQTPFFDTAAEDFPIAVLRGGKGLPMGGWEAVQQEAAATIGQLIQASGTGSVAIGGSVSDSTIITGDGNSVQRGRFNIHADQLSGSAIGDGAQVWNNPGTVRQNYGQEHNINTDGGAYIGGNVNTRGGDFVGRDKVVHGDVVHGDKVGGDKISVGNISGSTGVAIGRNSSSTVHQGGGQGSQGPDRVAALFAPIYRAIQESAGARELVKQNLLASLRALEEQARKGGQADREEIAGCLEMLGLKPEILSLARGALAQLGLAT